MKTNEALIVKALIVCIEHLGPTSVYAELGPNLGVHIG